MKRLHRLCFLLVCLIGLQACSQDADQQPAESQAPDVEVSELVEPEAAESEAEESEAEESEAQAQPGETGAAPAEQEMPEGDLAPADTVIESAVIEPEVEAVSDAAAELNEAEAGVDDASEIADQLAAVESVAVDSRPQGSLNSNDVSILFPLPLTAEDVAGLIHIKDLLGADGNPALPESDFARIMTVAESEASRIASRKITLTEAQKNFADWVVAGIRFDPSAPGSSERLINIFGSLPQIRLVIQPVTTDGETVLVHDVAMQLAYDYFSARPLGQPGSVGKAVADSEAVTAILTDLIEIKAISEDAGVDTDVAQDVHPGLAAGLEGLGERIEAFLGRHTSAKRFNSAAVTGQSENRFAPRIFMSLSRVPETSGQFRAFPTPGLGSVANPRTAQMLSFLDTPNVQPQPSSTNRMEISNNLLTASRNRRGVSTAVLFSSIELDAQVAVGVDEQGGTVFDAVLRNADIADIIANPAISHLYNTDCVSCHTETTRREILQLEASRLAFDVPEGVAPVADAVTPADKWNVRNFGWFNTAATITRRTANETAEAVAYIRANLLKPVADATGEEAGE